MSTTNGKKLFAVLAAVCFLLAASYDVIRTLINIESFVRWFDFYSFTNLLYYGYLVAMGVLLLIGKKNLGLVIVAGVEVLTRMIFLARYLSLANTLSFLASAAFLALILFHCIPAMHKVAATSKYYWYAPGALQALTCLISFANIMRYSNAANIILYFLLYSVQIASMVLTGAWLASSLQKVPAAPAYGQSPYPPQQPAYGQNPYAQPQQPAYSQNPYAQPQQPAYGQNPYAQPQQPAYSQNPYAQPQQPAYGQNPYARPQQPAQADPAATGGEG